MLLTSFSGETKRSPQNIPDWDALGASLVCCLVVVASHGPLRAQRGGVVLRLGLGAAALRVGLTGADTGLLLGRRIRLRAVRLPLRRLQRLLDQPQHELPLGQLPARALRLTLQVRFDPLPNR